uniref:Protocadherin 2 alpha a 1 n=1 Tax=Kryptolebias marmoratus TaxID=37003 RepID=A0A3Q3ALF4_KRYMA
MEGNLQNQSFWWISGLLLLCFVDRIFAQLKYSVPEHVQVGSPVGNVAKDLGLDIGSLPSRRFRIVSGPNHALFALNQNNGVMSVAQNADREVLCDGTKVCLIKTVSQYDITITATDCGEPQLYKVKTLHIQVSDVNDNIPVFSQNPVELYLVENNSAGAAIFSITATDEDLNENAAISYHIAKADGVKGEMASYLNINSENGLITALKSFDFENLKTFQFHVVATDSGAPSLSSNFFLFSTSFV